MSQPDRSAAGPAAGFHFQIQRSLVALLAAGDGSEVSIETLDDIVVHSPTGRLRYDQLKHSLQPGTLSDSSGPLWKALAAWMDVEARPGTESVQFRLVATHEAVDESAAAALRPRGTRDIKEAERLLLVVAATAPDPLPDGASELQKTRARFRDLPTDRRRGLLARISVHDGDGDIGDLRQKLSSVLGPTSMPRTGADIFLNQIVGWWEEAAAAMLLGNRETVSYEEVVDHVRAVRDTFSEGRLPDLDQDLHQGLTDSVIDAYKNTVFVRQLELLVLLEPRVQQAISDYHRAYVQRSRWVKQSVLSASELDTWEDALLDEWRHAFLAMVDELPAGVSTAERAEAGKRFFGTMERSSNVPLRDGRHPVLQRGTMHGLSDLRRVGWHPDFEVLLHGSLVRAASAPSSSAYDEHGSA